MKNHEQNSHINQHHNHQHHLEHGSYLFPNRSDPNEKRKSSNNNNTSGNASNTHHINHPMHNKFKNNMYNVWQCRIYNFLERPRGYLSGLYHSIM